LFSYSTIQLCNNFFFYWYRKSKNLLVLKYLHSLPSSQKYGDPGSKIRKKLVTDLDPGVQKARDPGSATLRLFIPKDLHTGWTLFSEGQHRFLLMIQINVILKRQITKYTPFRNRGSHCSPWLCLKTDISANNPFAVRKTFAQVVRESFY
jgi:hypothetical protein